jgi:phosphomethylpyrimidine synthase
MTNRRKVYVEGSRPDVRVYAAEHGMSPEAAIELGMKEKSAEFAELGGELYVPRQ